MDSKLIKARIGYVCFFVCLAFSTVTIINLIEHEHIKSVNSTLVTNKTIIVDAGHGTPDERCNWF